MMQHPQEESAFWTAVSSVCNDMKDIPEFRLARLYSHRAPQSPQDPVFKHSCTINMLGEKLAQANETICRLQTERDAAFARANAASQQSHAAQQSAIDALTRALEMQHHSQQENDALRGKLAAAEHSHREEDALRGRLAAAEHLQQENGALRCKLAAAEQNLKSIKMLCG